MNVERSITTQKIELLQFWIMVELQRIKVAFYFCSNPKEGILKINEWFKTCVHCEIN
jgi:hypothetical protein